MTRRATRYIPGLVVDLRAQVGEDDIDEVVLEPLEPDDRADDLMNAQ